MKYKKLFGWLIIIILSMIPFFLWYFLGSGTESFSNYSSITHSLGEIFGLVGMTMFALTFILSTRISFIEDIFDGLDKVYIAHGVLGGTALTLILFHPIFLVLKFVPGNLRQAALYLLPSSYWSINFGIIALIGMIFLIYLTLFTKIKYHKWKFTHEFLGLIFLFAILHIFLVRGNASQDDIFTGYYIYATIVSLIGFSAFSYSLFLKDRLFKAAVYRIGAITKKNAHTYEINLIPEHKPISYKSGQFVFLRFYNKNLGKEPHPFSIASRSDSPVLKIIIKNLGDFTSKLIHLNVGERVSIEGPYGRFNYKIGEKDQIWLAGGIGITPFIGMSEDMNNKLRFKNKVDLYYSVKSRDDFIGLDELKKFESNTPKFKFIPWVTEIDGYIELKDISKISGNIKNKEFYLCGPNSFKNSLKDSLINAGISKKDIHTEEFGFR